MTTIRIELSDEERDRIAQRVVELLRTGPRPHPTRQETAAELRISLRSVERHLAAGRLRTVKVGGRTLVDRASLDAMLEAGCR